MVRCARISKKWQGHTVEAAEILFKDLVEGRKKLELPVAPFFLYEPYNIPEELTLCKEQNKCLVLRSFLHDTVDPALPHPTFLVLRSLEGWLEVSSLLTRPLCIVFPGKPRPEQADEPTMQRIKVVFCVELWTAEDGMKKQLKKLPNDIPAGHYGKGKFRPLTWMQFETNGIAHVEARMHLMGRMLTVEQVHFPKSSKDLLPALPPTKPEAAKAETPDVVVADGIWHKDASALHGGKK